MLNYNGWANVHLKPFNDQTDFAMWLVKMRVVLIKQKRFGAITGKDPEGTSKEATAELDLQAHNDIMLYLSDEVERQVLNQGTTKDI